MMYVETQDDLEPLRLSRDKIERFLHLPIFKKLAIGCFVNVIDEHNTAGLQVYRCCEIVDVVEWVKIYHMGKSHTHIGLTLKFGKHKRDIRIKSISNQPFSRAEFDKWKIASEGAGLQLPTKDFVHWRQNAIRQVLNYQYSQADIEAIIKRKAQSSNKSKCTMRKVALIKEKDLALQNSDHDRVSKLDSKLLKLETRRREAALQGRRKLHLHCLLQQLSKRRNN